MCRWLAYTGNAIPLEDLLFRAKHSLIDQSMCSRSRETPTNGDGFGVGWFGSTRGPGLFRSTQPAWNDANLRDLAAQIESPLFLAHVRATSLATVPATNCHPFRWNDMLFVHNGEIHEVEKVRRDMVLEIAPDLFPNILGTTDSEAMFYLALTYGLRQEPIAALERMAGFVEAAGRRRGIPQALWMTIGVSDGETIWAVRYASDGDAPTLYYSRRLEDLDAIDAGLRDKLGPGARLVVSEPVGRFSEAWVPVPTGSALRIHRGEVEVLPFAPRTP